MRNDNFQQNYNIINERCWIAKVIDQINPLWDYAIDVYEKNNLIESFCKNNSSLIQDKINEIDFDFIENHPILGTCTAKHSYFKKPLYRYVDLNEPSFTKALSCFLLENQKCCKAFVESVFELLEKTMVGGLPDEGYDCLYEVVTKKVKGKNRKRIDNIITWNDKLLCIEIKFTAKIDNNDLKAYQEQAQKMQKDKSCDSNNIFCVVISIDNIQSDIDKKRCSAWKNVLWNDLLKLWEKRMCSPNYEENEDMTRYRTSLWYKILGEEEN